MTYQQIYESNPAYWKSVGNVKATYLRAMEKIRREALEAAYELQDMIHERDRIREGW
jgi:hypothetical protein